MSAYQNKLRNAKVVRGLTQAGSILIIKFSAGLKIDHKMAIPHCFLQYH